MSELPTGAVRAVESHAWEREQHEHYVEPLWTSARLFEEERFGQLIWDPACGFGRIAMSAFTRGYQVWRSDIVQRDPLAIDFVADFLSMKHGVRAADIVTNPPFDLFKEFAQHALLLARHKVAMIWTVRTLPAARWLEATPLRRVLFLTPRPSMPPGHTITAGEKPGGGKQDYCWLIWEKGYVGKPEVGWLRRDTHEHKGSNA